VVRVGGISRLRPVIGANQYNQPLLACINHSGESLLQYEIAFLKRQQRQNIGLWSEPLVQPEVRVMDHEEANHQAP
jgi:hypothetical protein